MGEECIGLDQSEIYEITSEEITSTALEFIILSYNM
jgi:hypothetical protein